MLKKLWAAIVGLFQTSAAPEAVPAAKKAATKTKRYGEVVLLITREAPALAVEGLTRKEAAARLGVDYSTFCNMVRVHHPGLFFKSNQTGGKRRGREAKMHAKTKAMLQAAPALALEGLTKAQAAERLGVTTKAFVTATNRYLPNMPFEKGQRGAKAGLEVADGRKNGRKKGTLTQLVLTEGPKLAERGLTKSEAARELGVAPSYFSRISSELMPEVEFAVSPKYHRGSKAPKPEPKVPLVGTDHERIVAEAPALAASGLTAAQAAQQLGVGADMFDAAIAWYLPELEFTKVAKQVGRPVGYRSNRTRVIIDQAPALAAKGLTKSQAAKELGIDRSTFGKVVRQHLPDLEFHISPQGVARWGGIDTNRVKREAPAMFARGMTLAEVARELRVSQAAVTAAVDAPAAPPKEEPEPVPAAPQDAPKAPRPGSQTARVVEEAPAMAARGMGLSDIAKELGVNPGTVHCALANYLPDLVVPKINGHGGRGKGETTRIILLEAPDHAARGLTINEAAAEIGISKKQYRNAVRRYAPELKFKRSRKAPAKAERKSTQEQLPLAIDGEQFLYQHPYVH